jgi:hypothetical protein
MPALLKPVVEQEYLTQEVSDTPVNVFASVAAYACYHWIQGRSLMRKCCFLDHFLMKQVIISD